METFNVSLYITLLIKKRWIGPHPLNSINFFFMIKKNKKRKEKKGQDPHTPPNTRSLEEKQCSSATYLSLLHMSSLTFSPPSQISQLFLVFSYSPIQTSLLCIIITTPKDSSPQGLFIPFSLISFFRCLSY